MITEIYREGNKMILRKVSYSEHEGRAHYWNIREVCLGNFNLVVGLNASGKTRFFNILSNLSKILTKKIKPTDGFWNLEFRPLDREGPYLYTLRIADGKIENEKIIVGGKVLLDRSTEKGEIFSFSQSKPIDINPPPEELVISIRRDKIEFPFLEELYAWAENFYGYAFCASTHEIVIPPVQKPSVFLESLALVPYILKEALQGADIKSAIVEDLHAIGYSVNDVRVGSALIPGAPPGILLAELQESDLQCSTTQLAMSLGMFRSFALIVILEYILKMNKYCTIAVDDLGEGLDYSRATKLTELLFSKVRDSKIQLLATSNSRFLINNVPINDVNILERHGHIVDSYNYFNSKEKFDEFKITGLSSFDFFTGKMYKEQNGEKN